MPLALTCACGTPFEVEETFAGQTVSCPECQRGVQAPALNREPPKTSGYALASTIFALVLAFTGVGTVVAVLLGIAGLVSISRHRGRLAGTGYAVFGIVWGLLFTGLFAFAVIKGEVFSVGELLREKQMGGDLERGGELEVKRPAEGYAIKRPSSKWSVGKAALAQKLVSNRNDLVLVNLAGEGYIGISRESLRFNTFDGYRQDVLDRYKGGNPTGEEFGKLKPRLSNRRVRHNKRLPSTEETEQAELFLDVKFGGGNVTFLVRLVHPLGSDTVYLIQAWAPRRKFASMEPEIRQAMDSFRLLNP